MWLFYTLCEIPVVGRLLMSPTTRVPHVRSCPPRVGMLRGHLSFLVSWFLGFLVSTFLGFKVSWLLGFNVSWFESFLVSKFQRLAKCPFHVFWKRLISYKKSRSYETDLRDLLAPVFSMFLKRPDFHLLRFIKTSMFHKRFCFC